MITLNRQTTSETSRPTTPIATPQPPIVCAIPDKPNQYFVEAENKQFAYKLTWDGTNGKCTCQAYAAGVRQSNAFQCSHIIAAKTHPPSSTKKTQKETEMEIGAILNRSFPADKIKTKPNGTKYIETADVIERLNDAFGNTGWSFSHKEPIEIDDTQEVVCSGRIEAYIGDRLVFKEHSSSYKYGAGFNGEEFMSYGESRKKAIQMTLEECASLFGIGLKQLYVNKPTTPTGFTPPPHTNNHHHPTGFPGNTFANNEIPF